MKISPKLIKQTPSNMDWTLCVFGTPNSEVQEWIDFHGFETQQSGKFVNIIVPDNVQLIDIFDFQHDFEFMDGFSPNLNKHLHIGHFSNLVLAKAFSSLGVAKNNISILGDTLDGEVPKEEALAKFHDITKEMFNYPIDKLFFASEMEVTKTEMVDGTEKYEGTKGFIIPADFDFDEDTFIVGIKSSGETSYFYQDVALQEALGAKTLYLTGSEQSQHFRCLEELGFPVQHIPLGLVGVKGKKMSSREGNVVYLQEAIDYVYSIFHDLKLTYNVLAGLILSTSPSKNKNIDLDRIEDVKSSHGLYLSYTMARLFSAGVNPNTLDNFTDKRLEYAYINAYHNLSPNQLFSALVDYCKEINNLYTTHRIKDNPKNHQMFQVLQDNLVHGVKLLGLYFTMAV